MTKKTFFSDVPHPFEGVAASTLTRNAIASRPLGPQVSGATLPVHESNLSALPLEEQAKRYRDLARYALRESVGVRGDVHETYILLAERWQRLAQEAEEDLAQAERETAGRERDKVGQEGRVPCPPLADALPADALADATDKALKDPSSPA